MSSSTRPPSPESRSYAPERRRDLVTGHWVVIAGDRHGRPQDFPFLLAPEAPIAASCAFCAGREQETTPALASYSASDDPAGTWRVRVVSNLYPAFVVEPPTADCRDASSGSDRMQERSVGQHEVIIESATHRRRLSELSLGEVEWVFRAYRDRFRSLRRDGRFRYVLIFKNSGREAGMSREHLHSQLVALPEVPPLPRLELRRSARFYRSHQRCIFCHLIDETITQRSRVVLETDTALAFCPFASRVAYEVWVLPKRHEACFDQTDDRLLCDVAHTMHTLVTRMEHSLGPVPYNLVLHSSPFDTRCQDHYHWHIEILPRTSRLAGLEWGSGLLVNTMLPELAAEQLRQMAKA